MALFDRLLRPKKQGVRVTEHTKTRESGRSARRLSYQAANLQMIGARERQEDSFAILNAMDVTQILQYGLFAIVADGMGGMQDGRQVSAAAVTECIGLFHSLDRGGNIPKQLYDGIHNTNACLFERFKGQGGTTAVLGLFYNEHLYWASVGDSAIYLKRGNGLFQLNKEHTYANELYLDELYKENIDKTRVEENEDGIRLSSFLGMDSLTEVDFNKRPLRLKAGDTLLFCSDGISGTLCEEEIMDALSLTPPEACACLNDGIVQKARRKQDNYTGLIINCQI